MTQLINDTGFVADDWEIAFTPLGDAANDAQALDVPADADPDTLPLKSHMIRVAFPSTGDGRGFTIARVLRLRGYQGRLRAYGRIISDQYAMARRAGFDEVEIEDDIVARQPEGEWQFRSNWRAHDYQTRVRGTALA